MEGASECAGELGVGDGGRGGEIHGAGECRGFEKKENGSNDVVEADPAHPLSAGAERSAKTEPEDGKHTRESTGAWSECHREAEVNDTGPGSCIVMRGGFPLLAKIGDEAGARCG